MVCKNSFEDPFHSLAISNLFQMSLFTLPSVQRKWERKTTTVPLPLLYPLPPNPSLYVTSWDSPLRTQRNHHSFPLATEAHHHNFTFHVFATAGARIGRLMTFSSGVLAYIRCIDPYPQVRPEYFARLYMNSI